MFIPEYSITPNILKNIASIEYNRALIDNIPLLQNFEVRLEKEATIEYYLASLRLLGLNTNFTEIKKYVENLSNEFKPEIKGLVNGLKYIKEASKTTRIEEEDIKTVHIIVSEYLSSLEPHPDRYRQINMELKVDPGEIFSEIVELTDWFNSLDSTETNPVIVAGIIKAQLEIIHPYNKLNFLVADLITKSALLSRGYLLANYLSIETYYYNSQKDYEHNLKSIIIEDYDLTAWLEYFTIGVSQQVAKAAEKVKLLGKDTKLAKVSGRVNLTPRQEQIVEYLQDYGVLYNKQFSSLFPNVSEDSVLRDLKKLIDEGTVVKRGSTKSSRYELG